MSTFTINGKRYNSKEFDFNIVCDLSEVGINMEEADRKSLPLLRAYFAFCAGVSTEVAGEQISKHVISGGKLDELIEVMTEEMESSDFFRALNKTEEEEVTAETTETATKKTTKK